MYTCIMFVAGLYLKYVYTLQDFGHCIIIVSYFMSWWAEGVRSLVK